MKLKDLLSTVDYSDYYLIDVVVIITYVCLFYYGMYIFKKIKGERKNEIN